MDFKKQHEWAWTGLIWLRTGEKRGALVNAVMNFRFPHNAGNFLTSFETTSFFRGTLLHTVTLPTMVTTQPHNLKEALLM
jgi:hypothetical protein